MRTGGGSDHASFFARKIPVLFFCVGGNPDYHTPSDTLDKIDFGNLVKTARLAYLVAARLSASGVRSAFVEPKREGRSGGRGVRLGIFPDEWYDGKGARIESVSRGTPAHRAGLERGDIILEFEDRWVESIGELRPMLNMTERGSSVRIVYLRDGKIHTVAVRFD